MNDMDHSRKNDSGPRTAITWRSFILGFLVATCFTVITVLMRNRTLEPISMTLTQLAVMPYLLLVLMVLLLNPLLRLLHVIRPFSMTELMIIFIMGAVSSGISDSGLASHLVPVVSGLYAPAWNNAQARWDVNVQPYLEDRFFIAEPGTMQASIKFRDARDEWDTVWQTYQAASTLLDTRAELTGIREEWEAFLSDTAAADNPVGRAALERRIEVSEGMAARAERAWNELASPTPADVVAATWADKVAAHEATVEEAQKELDALEERAFAKITDFRRGLPRDMRAAPGVVPIKGETHAIYTARLRRLTKGMTALKDLRRAEAALADSASEMDRMQIARHLESALTVLSSLSELGELEAAMERIDKRLADCEQDVADIGSYVRLLVEKERNFRTISTQQRFARLKHSLGKRHMKLLHRRTSIEKERDIAVLPAIKMVERVAAARDRLAGILERTRSLDPRDRSVLLADVRNLIADFATFDVSYRRFFAGSVPWRAWLRPLFNWGLLIVLLYVMLMTFNVLIYRQWANHEKLVYPLAELPAILTGSGEKKADAVPPLYKSGLFWGSFSCATFVLLWNEYVYGEGLLGGFAKFNLSIIWDQHIANTIFEGLTHAGRHEIVFVVIGLAFLIPARISFSLWAFHVFFYVQLLLLVALGVGVNWMSFPFSVAEPVMNFRTAQGGGALLVFGVLLLWKCRRYIACSVTRDPLADLEPGERTELRVSSILFLVSSLGLVLAFVFHLGTNIYYAIFFYLIILLITVTMTRAAAEGGVIGLQCAFSPMHLLRTMFGFDRTWTSPALLAPLTVFYNIMFFDLNTFVAPAMANAMKIRENYAMKRAKFHAAIILSILVAASLGVAVHIITSYHNGADVIQSYPYRHMSKNMFNAIRDMAKTNPVDTAGGIWWLLGGAVGMAALLYGRRKVFWLPHPIGLVMFVVPSMNAYWFSFMLGWFFKVLVSKYGNQNTYLTFRRFFIGLIVAELVLNALGIGTLNRGY